MKNNYFTGEAIGKRLQAVRGSRRCSQEELAEELGVSGEDIMQYEAGTGELAMDVVGKIADYIGTSLDYLTMKSTIDLPAQYAKAYPF